MSGGSWLSKKKPLEIPSPQSSRGKEERESSTFLAKKRDLKGHTLGTTPLGKEEEENLKLFLPSARRPLTKRPTPILSPPKRNFSVCPLAEGGEIPPLPSSAGS